MGRSRKIILFVAGIVVISIILVFIKYMDLIFQEGNPIYVGYAIIKLHLSGENIVEIPRNNKYIMKSKLGNESFIKYKEEEGWNFIERLGAGLIFEKNGQRKVAISRMFTRKYIVIVDFE